MIFMIFITWDKYKFQYNIILGGGYVKRQKYSLEVRNASHIQESVNILHHISEY